MARPRDRDVFLATLLECGGRASNAGLQGKLGWDGTKYWRVHASLYDEGAIEKGKGYSGTVILVPDADPEGVEAVKEELKDKLSIQTPVSISEDEEEEILQESQLYEPAQMQLQEHWSIWQNLDQTHVDNIARQGARDTGGSWSRPDLAIIALKTFEYLPDRIMEVHTFEIKASYDVTVKGVMEALAHREVATRAYVIYHTAGRDLADFPEASRIEALANRYGIGVFAAKDIGDFNEWAEVVPAERASPDPDQVETFIKRSLSDEARSKILKWRR